MIIRGEQITADIREKADVCIIGSGAGGAVAAKELAEAGLKVVVLEEGGYHTKEDFDRLPSHMFELLYRDFGMTTSLGLPPVIIPLGKVVGGTTVINSGTCFWTPDKVLKKWQTEHGLEITSEEMAPYFRRVEEFLQVSEVPLDVIGKNALIFKRGVEALGYHGAPLRRNAVNEHGCGACAFGCPTDTKQAMHITYIPAAVEHGAKVYANCRAERVTMNGKRIEKVHGVFINEKTGQTTHRMEVETRVVVLAAGAIYTPVFLLRNRLANRSGQVGRNLSLHPAVRVAALFDEVVEGWKGVPQSYYVDEFIDEGIILEGIFVPPSVEAMTMPYFGKKQQEIFANYRHIATFGLMVSDSSRGRVRQFKGRPLITYALNRDDTRKILKGVEIVARIFFAAGAKKVYPGIHGLEEINSPDEIGRITGEKHHGTDLELSAYHPLGTARMGTDPTRSVINQYGRSHDVPNLFIADGSIFPSSLGVNPQISIMGFANRTADHIRDHWGDF